MNDQQNMRLGAQFVKVLILLAHPRGQSTFCGGLAQAYAEGARAAGCTVKTLDLAAIKFNPDVMTPSPREQALEADLVAARGTIEWADHIVFVYPTWWGVFPARLKGFLDRLLTPGWAFEEISGGTGYAGLLGGRTAELITTMDTPGLVYDWLYGAPGRKAMARATLGFCGIDVVSHKRFGPVKSSTPTTRATWLDEARRRGGLLARGPYTAGQRLWRRISPWLAALRLQFYPMTFLAYWIGALLTNTQGAGLSAARFWAGYALLFLLEAATVFTNDRLDYDTDSRNPNWGPFNGGSRALLGGGLTARALWLGGIFALVGAGMLALGLVATSAEPWTLALFLLVSTVIAVGYTAPPLQLSYRALGELDVGLTHSFMAIMAGRIFQNAAALDTRSFWIAAPMFLSILPSIALSAIPDRDADAEAGKKTLAVALGIGAVYRLAAVVAVLAALAALITQTLVVSVYGWMAIVAIMIHALWLARTCLRQGALGVAARRIDSLMVVALTFILWFCIAPLFSL